MSDPHLARRIEEAALWAWPPRETAFVEGWLLGAAGGHTRRANSARTASFAAAADVGRAIARVEAWYAARGLPARFQLSAFSLPDDLDGTLARRGYAPRSPSLVLVLAGKPVRQRTDVELASRPTPLVMNAICDRHWGPPTRRARAALFGRIRRPHVFAVAVAGGEPVGGALCVRDGELAGIFSLQTQPPFQRRGHARAIVARLIGWAHDHGARLVYLQVEEANAPARALFAGFGGEPAYRYWYREQMPAD